MLFAFFAAMAETERESIREGLDAAARNGRHGGRPTVITDDMLHTVLRRRATGETVDNERRERLQQARKQSCPALSLFFAGNYGEAWSDATGRSPS